VFGLSQESFKGLKSAGHQRLMALPCGCCCQDF